MNGFTRFVLAGGLIVAASQLVAGPLADWNARREGAAELKRMAQPKKKSDEE
uniref:RxLR effector protein n=1 Tax=Globisporangium ultimum (strain ATCC 200006 / CBS 805.95 / DAOM BR144) TaxID=431595 RepID=K3X100_GLOUD